MSNKNYKIGKILKKIDYFGIQFNFHYKGRDKYNSILSGFAFIVFIFITIFYIIYSLISFVNRENLTVTYYDILTHQAKKIDFEKFSLNFAYGLTCSGYTAQELDEYFYITPSHMTRETINGTVKKTQIRFNNTFCTEEDFYNNLNSSFNELKLSNYYCVPRNYSVEGVYVDNIFSYFQFVISAKKTSPEFYENYYKILRGDCKFEVYYIDHIIDVDRFKQPLQSSIEQIFMQLSPVNYKKMNIYFRQQEFSSDSAYIFDKKKTNIYGGYSRYEEYSLYLGPERFSDKIANYYAFGTIYVRADRNKRIISRRYQKLTEFAASCSSLLSQLLLWMFLFFSNLNRFYANQSLIKNIFQLRNDKQSNFKNIKKIIKDEKIKSFVESYEKDKSKIEDDSNEKYLEIKNSESKFIKISSNKNATSNNINIYNDINKYINSNKNNEINNNKNNISNNEINNISNNNNSNNMINDNNNNRIITHFTQNSPNKLNISKNIIEEGLLSIMSLKKSLKKEKSFNKKFSINCCELCYYKFFCKKFHCCNDLKINNLLYKKAKKMLNIELDILTYLKTTQTVYLLNFILLEHYQSTCLKFISKPSISLANKMSVFEKIHYIENLNRDFSEFEKDFQFLLKKNNKNNLEKKLLNLVEMEINNLIN